MRKVEAPPGLNIMAEKREKKTASGATLTQLARLRLEGLHINKCH